MTLTRELSVDAEKIRALLRRQKVATMPELKEALGKGQAELRDGNPQMSPETEKAIDKLFPILFPGGATPSKQKGVAMATTLGLI